MNLQLVTGTKFYPRCAGCRRTVEAGTDSRENVYADLDGLPLTDYYCALCAGDKPRRGRPPKAKPVPSEVPAAPPEPAVPEITEQPLPEQTEGTRLAHDIAVLDRGLAVLAEIEDIINRYKHELEALKELI